MTIEEMIERAHRTAKEKGWWDSVPGQPDRGFPEQIALMHSELSEALEDYRVYGLEPDKFLHGYQGHPHITKPCGIASELADVLIRIADTCGRYGIPLEAALEAKLTYNEIRPHRHGGKKC